MAGETTTMPALVVDGGTDAYWGIKELDNITDNMELTVKLIRNFVNLTATISADPDVFRMLGYTVVNRPSSGTVAPYIYKDHLFATVLDAMNGAAHNNLSTSVVTRDLFSIGYEGEKIEVSSTRVIFTEQTAGYALRFRYTPANGQTFDPTNLRIYDVSDEATEYDVSGATATGASVRQRVTLIFAAMSNANLCGYVAR